ncbi:MAG: DUF5666 domain-containing protein [Actinomycetales bacterium]
MMRAVISSPNVHRSDPTMLLQTSKPRRIALGALIVGIACVLAGCSAAAPAAPAASRAGHAPGSFGRNGIPGGGGIFGQIAAVNGNTLQVQSQSAQTAVNVSASTTILQTAKATASDVTVGSCIVASAFPAAGSSASSSPSGAVTSVSISAATNGTCTGGGFRFGPRNGTRPSASPRPSTPRNGAFTAPVTGLVTAVSGSTITVSVKNSSGAASSKEVTTSSSTAYTLTSSATSAALSVGRCAAVRGATGTSGAVAATSVTVSDPGANGCSAGFGRGGGRGGPSAPQSGSSGGNA